MTQQLKNNTYLYPQFICRVAGLPTSSLNKLKSEETAKTVQQIINHFNDFAKLKNQLSDLLFIGIGKTNEKKVRSRLLSLKRNLNKIDYFEYSKSTSILKLEDEDFTNELLYLKRNIIGRNELLASYKNVYIKELERCRNDFKALVDNEDFQKGLIISSKTLFSMKNIYIDSNTLKTDSRVEQIERGLLKYYSRMVMKATPFSTFCSIIPGYTENYLNNDLKNPIMKLSDDPSKKKSLVLLNKDIYGKINEYMLNCSDIRKYLYLEKNPTTELCTDLFRFLTEFSGKEVFQELENNDVISFIDSILNKTGKVKFNELVKKIKGIECVDASEEDVVIYLDKLIELGFLRLILGIPNQEIDWSQKLIELLKDIDNEKAIKLLELLEHLVKGVKSYAQSDVYARSRILNEMNEKIKSVFRDLVINPLEKENLPIYEDATADSKVILDKDAISESLTVFTKVIELTRKTCYPRTEHLAMRHFYDNYYKGANDGGIELLRFYEDYYREHYKSHLEKKQKFDAGIIDEEIINYNSGNPFKLDVVSQIHKFQDKLKEFVVNKAQEVAIPEYVNISLVELEEMLKDIPEQAKQCDSISFYVNLVQSDKFSNKALFLVQNCRYFTGFGKFYSRFMHLFPNEERRKLLDSNNEMSDSILAEICHDSNFNANLHPVLLEYEIVYPTSEGGLANKKILCNDIIVKKHPYDRYSLILFDKKKCRRIIPIDLGFLNPFKRPPLFFLLAKFIPSFYFGFNFLEAIDVASNYTNDSNKTSINRGILNKITYWPRIVVGNSVVVSRKRWVIPSALFPSKKPNETNSDYFLRVNIWKYENGIPDEIYIVMQLIPRKMKDYTVKDNIEQVVEIIKDEDSKKLLNDDETLINVEDKVENLITSDLNPKDNDTAHLANNNNIKIDKNPPDYHKPQYIDFKNILLVNLFGKITSNYTNYIVIAEERYPAENKLLDFNGLSFVNELVLQINFPDINIEKEVK